MEKRNIRLSEAVLDHHFQDWLVLNRVMGRYDVPLQKFAFKVKSRGVRRISDRIFDMLYQRRGYLVSTQEIAIATYGTRKQRNIALVNSWMDYLRSEKLVDPNILFQARKLGWAFGVSSLGVTANSFLVLYRLWLDQQSPVQEKELAYALHGIDDEFAISSARKQTSKLRLHELPPTNARILKLPSVQDSEHQYQLLTRDQFDEEIANLEKPKNQIRVPAYLRHDFQDWLSNIGLVILKSDVEKRQIDSLDMNRKDHLLLSILQENYGYIVPYSVLSTRLYGVPDQIDKVREIFSYLKDTKVLPAKDVFVLSETGIGMAIENILLTQKQLKLLHVLWNVERAHYFDFVGKKVYGKYDDEVKNSLLSLVSKTRKALETVGYRIVLYDDQKGKRYRLERKHRL